MFSGAFATQNCRNSIIAPGRQEIGYGSLIGHVKVDCPGVFLPSVTSGSSVFSWELVAARWPFVANLTCSFVEPCKVHSLYFRTSTDSFLTSVSVLKAGELRWGYFVVSLQKAEVLLYQNQKVLQNILKPDLVFMRAWCAGCHKRPQSLTPGLDGVTQSKEKDF